MTAQPHVRYADGTVEPLRVVAIPELRLFTLPEPEPEPEPRKQPEHDANCGRRAVVVRQGVVGNENR